MLLAKPLERLFENHCAETVRPRTMAGLRDGAGGGRGLVALVISRDGVDEPALDRAAAAHFLRRPRGLAAFLKLLRSRRRPDRMIPAHRHTPVRHRALRIAFGD